MHSDSTQPRLCELEGTETLAAALRPIYAAATAEAASAALEAFARGPWGASFRRSSPPGVVPGRHVIPFFAFPPDVRRIIYTTNALESVHAQLRKIIKTRGHFPTDEAATKLIWLALRISPGSGRAGAIHWKTRCVSLRSSTKIASSPARRGDASDGRCRRCGRTERAHSDLETAENAVSHSAHTHHRLKEREEQTRGRQPALHTKFRTLPTDATAAMRALYRLTASLCSEVTKRLCGRHRAPTALGTPQAPWGRSIETLLSVAYLYLSTAAAPRRLPTSALHRQSPYSNLTLFHSAGAS